MLSLLGWEPIYHAEVTGHHGWRNIGEKRYLYIGADGLPGTQALYPSTADWPVRTDVSEAELRIVLTAVGAV